MPAIDRLASLQESLNAVQSVLDCVNVKLLCDTGITEEQVEARRLYYAIVDAVDELEDLRDELTDKIAKVRPKAERQLERQRAEDNAAAMEAK
jgi:hypothetical protein